MAIVSVDTPRAMRCGTSPPPAHNYHTPAQAGFDIGTDPSPNTLQPTNSLARFVLGETTLRQTTSPTAKPRHPRPSHATHDCPRTTLHTPQPNRTGYEVPEIAVAIMVENIRCATTRCANEPLQPIRHAREWYQAWVPRV